jgi:hypothetical protein
MIQITQYSPGSMIPLPRFFLTGRTRCQLWNRNFQNRSWLRLHRSRRSPFLRHGCNHRQGTKHYCIVQRKGSRQVKNPHQDCSHMGRNQGGRNSRKGGNHLQSHTYLFQGSSDCMCRSRVYSHLTICGKDHGLVQEE